jgi:hypothetical protein
MTNKMQKHRSSSLGRHPSDDLKLADYRQRLCALSDLFDAFKDGGNASSKGGRTSILSSLSPKCSLPSLEKETEEVETAIEKEVRKADNGKSGGLISWIRKLGRRKPGSKTQSSLDVLTQKLEHAKEDVDLWLAALEEREDLTKKNSFALLEDMESSVDLYESYVDYYDELINEGLKINFEVSKEISDLRITGALNEVTKTIQSPSIPSVAPHLLL